METVKDRFKMLGLLIASLLYAVVMGVLFIASVLLIFVTPLDIPVWLCTGKAPVCNLIMKMSKIFEEF